MPKTTARPDGETSLLSASRPGSGVARPAQASWRAWCADRADLISVGALLLILLLAYGAYNPTLWTASSITILSAQFLPLVLAAAAQTVVMLTGGIDLSVGPRISLAMVVFAVLAQRGVLLALVAALVLATAVGALNGALVSLARLPSIIVTLATSFLWSGVALVVLSQPGGSVPRGLVRAYNRGWYGVALPATVVAIVLLVWLAVRRSRFGLSLYAVGGNSHGAYANGLRVRAVRIGAYAAGGVFAGLAGIGLAVQTGSGDPTLGDPYTLNSIAAAVLGGISFFGGVGRMAGAVMGALVIGVLSNLLLFVGVNPFYQLVLQGVVLIVAIAARTVLTRRRNFS